MHDRNSDKLDDRLEGMKGVQLVMLGFEGPLTPTQRAQLDALPGLRVLLEWRLVDGAWAMLDVGQWPSVAALPFIERIEWDMALEPQLDRSVAAIRAEDGRRVVLDDGTEVAQSRGVWLGDSRMYDGFTGRGVKIALLDGGIDDTHPSIDDVDDDPDTFDPKVVARMNAWGFALASAVVGPDAATSETPWFTTLPGEEAIPFESSKELRDIACEPLYPAGCPALVEDPWATVGPLVEVYGSLLCNTVPEVPCPPPVPHVDVWQDEPVDQAMADAMEAYADFIANGNQFTSLPHATALAGVIAGTGDTLDASGASDANPFDRWVYSGVAPEAELVDVNIFIGLDSECVAVAGCAPGAEPGSSMGVQVDLLNSLLVPTGGSTITGSEMILRYNEENPDDPVRVAVLPILDINTCGQNDAGTLLEAAVDALAQTNVTVIVSVGQNREEQGICTPANVGRALTVGAMDHHDNLDPSDDTGWAPMDRPNEDQSDMAKPDLVAPGVDVTAPRTRPVDYYTISGSSVAAAHAAGVAALVLEASNHTVLGMAMKEHLIQTARGDVDSRLDPAGFIDSPVDPETPGDGLHDDGNRTAWLRDWGFGILDARSAVCAVNACPMAWESVGASIVRIPGVSWPVEAGVNDVVHYEGQLLIDDMRAANFWRHHGPPEPTQYYENFGPAPAGIPVHFAFANNPFNVDVDDLVAVSTTFTDDSGLFNLSVAIPGDKPPGLGGCVIWSEALHAVAGGDVDSVAGASPVPCFLSVFSETRLEIDLCGEDKACDPTFPKVSFQDHPSVDVVRGLVRLVDGNGVPMDLRDLTVEWPGAAPGWETIKATTNTNDGEVLLEIPIRGDPGVFPLSVTYEPADQSLFPDAGNYLPAAIQVPVGVQVGARFEVSFQNIPEGTVLQNDNKPLPITVTGTLETLNGLPLKATPIDLLVEGRGTRTMGAAVTGQDGSFTSTFDARQLLSGPYSAYASFGGVPVPGSVDDYLVAPTESGRLAFSLVVSSDIGFTKGQVAHRGELLTIEGALQNVFNRPLGNRTVQIEWLGGSSFIQDVTTDRDGRFSLMVPLAIDEALGPQTLRARFAGDQDVAPTQAAMTVDVRGRSTLSVFHDQVQRSETVEISGFLFDDTGRPLPGQLVRVDWGPEHVGNFTTNSLGRWMAPYDVAADHRTGPMTVRAAFAGTDVLEGSNGQGVIGVISKTQLLVDQVGEANLAGTVEIVTQLRDADGAPLTSLNPLDVYLTPPQQSDDQVLTLLGSLDLADALTPELAIRHGFDFQQGFAVSDGAQLQASLDQGRTWTPVEPRTGYPAQSVAALGDTPGWSGQSSGWFPQSFDLSEYEGADDLRIRFRLASSPLNNDISYAIDNVVVRGDSTEIFRDDFEHYGNKFGTTFWQLTGSGEHDFAVGKETITGDGAHVLATNLAGTHPHGVSLLARSPPFEVVPQHQGHTYALVRYQLDTGNAGDTATLKARAGSLEVLLAPVGEPQVTTLPDTDDQWRWLLYEIPSTSRDAGGLAGSGVRLEVGFQSDAGTAGKGLLVDEVRIITDADLIEATKPDQPGSWLLTGFEHAPLQPIDAYTLQESNRPYAGVSGNGASFASGPINLVTPFPIDVFGSSGTTLTVHPTGILTVGDTRNADPSAFCTDQQGQFCRLSDLTGLGTPVIAPAFDPDLGGESASMGWDVVGTAPDRVVRIEWRDLATPGSSFANMRFQVRLHESGDVEFHYGTMFVGDDLHDLGRNATAGLGLPGVSGKVVEPHVHQAVLTDGLRSFYSRVKHDFAQGCNDVCAGVPSLVPKAGGTYGPLGTIEALFQDGFDISSYSEAYLVVRQYTELGSGDTLTVQGRPASLTTWRGLPAVMGGVTTGSGQVHVDASGEWETVVYDLSALVGERVQVRFQIASNDADEDIGVAIQSLQVVGMDRRTDDTDVHSFEGYVKEDVLPGPWWTTRMTGRQDNVQTWGWREHADAPDELGDRFLQVGGQGNPLPGTRQFHVVTPPIDLAGHVAPRLEFWQALHIADGLDGAVVEVSTDGGRTYRALHPDGSPYQDFAPVLNGPGWVQGTFGFRTDTFDLTPFASPDVNLRLVFAAGANPFPARWVVDDVRVSDRLDPDAVYLAEDGTFSEDRWNRAPGAWTPVPQASAVEHARAGHAPATTVAAPGAATTHRFPLPADTPRGPTTLTLLFNGQPDTSGGVVAHIPVTVSEATRIAELQVRNFFDGGDYAVRGHGLRVAGSVTEFSGAPVEEGLVQISIDGQVVGSARTSADGTFVAEGIAVPAAFELGNHRMTVEFTGIPAQYLQPSTVERNLAVLGTTVARVDEQVAQGEKFRVTFQVDDDLKNPLPRTGVRITFSDTGEVVQGITDSNGRVTFTRSVPSDQETELEFDVAVIGDGNLLASTDSVATVVPAARDEGLPWFWIILAGLVVLALAAIAVFMARRNRAHLEVGQALEKQLERLGYMLERGDPVRDTIFAAYGRFLKVLERAGRPRGLMETPSELARALGSELPRASSEDIGQLTTLFERARFSDQAMGETQRALAVRTSKNLQASLVPPPVEDGA